MISYLPNKYSFGDNTLPRKTINGRRHYMVGDLPLPSVTTVLNYEPKPQIQAWRARVGDAEADRISQQATYRGNQVHKMLEDYVQTGQIVTKGMMPSNIEQFFWIKNELDQNLTEVYASELSLYSLTLGIAGQVDMLGLWNGKKSVIDFKTSTRVKQEKYIDGYFKQEACYSFMAYERSSEHGESFFPNQLVTLIATEESRTCDVFIQRAAPWLEKATETITGYHKFILNGG